MKKFFFLFFCLFFFFLSVMPMARASIHPIRIDFVPHEREVTISNRTIYPIISTEVSGSGLFSMVSGGDQILYMGKEKEGGVLVFTINIAQWGCSYTVSAIFSDGNTGVVQINLCEKDVFIKFFGEDNEDDGE